MDHGCLRNSEEIGSEFDQILVGEYKPNLVYFGLKGVILIFWGKPKPCLMYLKRPQKA